MKRYKRHYSAAFNPSSAFQVVEQISKPKPIKMFSRFAIFTTLALPLFAVATDSQPASSCTTGPLQCCQSTETASSTAGSALLASIGVVVQDVNALLGVTCSPISVIGVGGDSCNANPVCCENNAFGGLVSIGCVPVDLAL
ncbi:hypothetical protein QCA50_000759 [Cerrena zonata]|uniref:Hydrophobin n=1 Tax=Cerrena zonata TaxID=2478898 RepID=A0AAW0GU77_9APHY